MNYTIEQLARAVNGTVSGPSGGIINGVSTDTRAIRENEAFFALKGDTHDGHDFLPGIRSCAAAVVSRPVPGLPFPCVLVRDTLEALGQFAAFHKKQYSPLAIGITGSVGKTSTKEMTASFLEELGPCVKTYANFNNEIGLPLTLFRVDGTTRTLVTEMGMRGRGQIEYLCHIAKPDIGIITNIGLTHIELLKTQDNIAAAKAELLEALPETGAAFVNLDGRYRELLKSRCKCRLLTFGASPDADIYPVDPELSDSGIRFSAVSPFGTIKDLFIPVPVEHYMINALAAMGAALYCGVSQGYIRDRLSAYKNIEKRFSIVTSPSGLTVIDDTYNANPASMDGAVRTLAKLQGKRKIAILGDMLELGDYAEDMHAALGRTVRELGIDRLYCVGPLSEHIARGAINAGMDSRCVKCCASSAEMSEALDPAEFGPGDCILVKGSRSVKMERISLLLVNM